MPRRLVLLLIAVALACVDLADKAATHAAYHHLRSPFVVFVATFVVIGLVAVVPRLASRGALLGAALAVGGALGNLVSALVWAQGVPDPIVARGPTGGVAFNLADVFLLVGDAVMLSAVLIYALRHRAELRTSL